MSLSVTDQYNSAIAQIKEDTPGEERIQTQLKKEENKYKALSDQLFANTNKKMIVFEMNRRKIEHIALDSGYTLGQYWMLAIYNTISDWDQETND